MEGKGLNGERKVEKIELVEGKRTKGSNRRVARKVKAVEVRLELQLLGLEIELKGLAKMEFLRL